MRKSFLVLFTILLFLPLLVTAQLSTNSKKALKYFQESTLLMNRRQYPEAVQVLLEAVNKDEDFYEAYVRLGNCFRILSDNERAEIAFTKAIASAPEHKVITTYFELGEVQFLQGKYQEAIESLEAYISKGGQGHRYYQDAVNILENARYAAKHVKDPLPINPRLVQGGVNAFPMQYFPVLTADGRHLIYTGRKGSDWQDDENIYISTLQPDSTWSAPASLSPAINSSFNEGTCTISADGRMIIFTSCLGRETVGSCDLFVSYKTGDRWSKPENMGRSINTGAWESQPTLSADGRTLYFVSNRRAGKGGYDIWVSYLDQEEKWTSAINMGSGINTPDDEVSPFIHVNGRTLFFASKGYQGFGGFDIYYSERSSNEWSEPENMGFPINTHDDQVSLFVTTDGKRAFYSLDEKKDGRITGSKIFTFDVPPEITLITESNLVVGKVFDAKTKKLLEANVELIDLTTDSLVAKVKSDPVSGEYMMVVNQGRQYALYVDKQGYLFKSFSFDYAQEAKNNTATIDIALQPIETGSITRLNNIFFAFDKYELQDQSKTELNKVVKFLQTNPEVKVEISGHTDNQGSAAYNQELSEKRAASVYKYLVENDVPEKQLSYKGYGQEQPVASNETEAGQAKNRRIEFKILENL